MGVLVVAAAFVPTLTVELAVATAETEKLALTIPAAPGRETPPENSAKAMENSMLAAAVVADICMPKAQLSRWVALAAAVAARGLPAVIPKQPRQVLLIQVAEVVAARAAYLLVDKMALPVVPVSCVSVSLRSCRSWLGRGC